jgi:predicted DCC family thiol-disulfide oxidoreductase YuxK
MRRPLFLYDGDCGFCRRWVERLRRRTGRRVVYRPSRRARHASLLVEPDGRRFGGALAVLRAAEHAPGRHPVARALRRWPASLASRAAYRAIADHRGLFGALDRLLIGGSLTDDPQWLLERGLGLVWLIAFASLHRQVRGLWGARGILPIRDYLDAADAQLPQADKLTLIPTIFWLDASDEQLVRACVAGEALALCVLLGIAPRASALAVWALYLSFVSVGRDFLGFQWDGLVLEAGLLAALGAPTVMYRWLLFRLYFESGIAKLQSHDPTWRTGRALCHYYETAPLPTRLGWWAHQLPRPLQGWSTALAVALELAAPFLIFLPRRPRLVGLGALTGFQLILAATANYGFFNLLTAVLGLSLLPRRLPRKRSRLGRVVGTLLSLPLFALSSTRLLRRIGAWKRRTPRLERLADASAPFHCVSPYGLFANMTLERPEIEVEGSDDGAVWRRYDFRYKMGPTDRAPRLVAPHQPRLDWQMWFAALTGPPRWFVSFLARLLDGSPEVAALLETNPFPDHPPRYVRATLWDYHMTDRATRRRTGQWWTRRRIGTYFPQASLSR